MKVSVVTISFNQSAHLRAALDSVLAQQGVDIEYIVVDGGSDDGSRELILEYKDRLSHIVFERDEGPADGLNKGLQLATGDIFYYLNSDDEIEPGAFAEAADIFGKTNVDVLYGNGLIIDDQGKIIRSVYSAAKFTPNLYVHGLAVIVQQAAFIRMGAIRQVGGFNRGNRSSWDGEAFFKLALEGYQFRRVWRKWGRFRVYPTSLSGSGKIRTQLVADHERLRAEAGLAAWSRPRRLLARVVTRVGDWRRWLSYGQGRFRPDGLR